MIRHTKWSNDLIIEIIKELYGKGADLTAGNISKIFKALFSTATRRRYFGNWGEAVKSAGIDYESIIAAANQVRIQRLKKWSPEKVIEEIKKIPKKEILLVYKFNLALHSAARREFGSWPKAAEAAGYDYLRLCEIVPNGCYTRWTKEKIFEKIKELYNTREAPDKGLNVSGRCPSLYPAACRVFGSWAEVLKEAGFDEAFIELNTQRRKWDKEKVIERIIGLYKAGEKLQSSYIQKKYPPLFSAATRELGSWQKAIAAAGLDYQEIEKSAKKNEGKNEGQT